ncbi:MAG: hypothetical protein ACLSAH_13800 [Bilophila wadsworthia]
MGEHLLRRSFGAGRVLRRTSMVTERAYRVRNMASSAAANLPPTTKTSLSVKNPPSHVAQ